MSLNKKGKFIAVTLIILVLAVAAMFAIVQMSGKKKENILKILPDEADVQIADFVYTEVGQDKMRWEIKAKTAQYQKKQNLALFDQVHLTLTTPEGKSFIMTGDKAEMLTDKKDVEIKGHVVIISDKGEKFSTDYIHYTDARKKIYTEAPVVMESERMKIQGVGLSILMNEGELTLFSKVKATIK